MILYNTICLRGFVVFMALYDFTVSEKLVVKDGKRWCTDLLDYLIEENDCIRDNETVIKRYAPANSSQDSVVINIYLVHDQSAKVCTTCLLIRMIFFNWKIRDWIFLPAENNQSVSVPNFVLGLPTLFRSSDFLLAAFKFWFWIPTNNQLLLFSVS